MAWWERIAALAAGLMLIDPTTITDVAGIAAMGLPTMFQYREAKQVRSAAADRPVPAEN
jgi:TRAP-type uncharacterized transport system fused permease subunit